MALRALSAIEDSPYRLPEGNVQIAFSGGRTSAYMLRQILDANGPLPDRCVVTFQNTGREMPQTLDFVHEVGERWNVPIVWLEYRAEKPWFEIVSHNSASRDGEPFEALIRKRKYLPNQQSRFCTTELKTRTAKRHLMSLGWRHWINCVGFRADEQHRINKPKPKDRWTVWTPLATAGVGKRDVPRCVASSNDRATGFSTPKARSARRTKGNASDEGTIRHRRR